jgi:flavin-dependent dehydrogenase
VLAGQGFRVAIIERDVELGLPVHCTGIVSTECIERYDLPRELAISPISSFVLRSPSGSGAAVSRRSVQAQVFDRIELDRAMVNRATTAGAELITSANVTDIRWAGDRVELTGELPGTTGMTARAAVVATGFGAKLVRRVGLDSSMELVSGCQVVVEADDLEQLEIFTGGSLGEGGFGWLVPWKPGYALAGLLTRRDTVTYLHDHVRRLQDDGRVGRVREVFRCRPIPVSLSRRAVVDGILGVGDAVGQVKPTSGGGIYFGMIGADAAAATLATALERGDLTQAGLMPYEHRWRSILEAEIHQGYALRRLIEQLPDSVVEHIHRLLKVPGLRRLLIAAAPSFDWHSGPLTKVLARLERHTESATAVAP